MAWDSRRSVPWRRLALYLAIYGAIMVALSLLTGGGTGSVASTLLIGLPIGALVTIVMIKFGWTMPILRSKEELAAERAARAARRAAARGTATPASSDRSRPAPTRRTSTGPTQHRRHTTKTRKR